MRNLFFVLALIVASAAAESLGSIGFRGLAAGDDRDCSDWTCDDEFEVKCPNVVGGSCQMCCKQQSSCDDATFFNNVGGQCKYFLSDSANDGT